MSFKYTKEMTAEQITDLLVGAIEGGINYWCSGVKIKGDSKGTDRWIQEIEKSLVEGETLLFLEDENEDGGETGKWHELTIDKFLKGLSETEGFDFENHDADTCDEIVQRALFGEIVYG